MHIVTSISRYVFFAFSYLYYSYTLIYVSSWYVGSQAKVSSWFEVVACWEVIIRSAEYGMCTQEIFLPFSSCTPARIWACPKNEACMGVVSIAKATLVRNLVYGI